MMKWREVNRSESLTVEGGNPFSGFWNWLAKLLLPKEGPGSPPKDKPQHGGGGGQPARPTAGFFWWPF